MKTKILKQTQIGGCPVIIRRIGKGMFEYLLVYENQFYGMFITNDLKWWQIKRFKKEPCTPNEINAMVHFLQKAAETTLETLLHKQKLKEQETIDADEKLKEEKDETGANNKNK